jgi:hypothetical protein
MSWSKEELAAFCNQDEQMMTLRILPANQLGYWIAAADRGDKEARASVLSVYDWIKQADAAMEKGAQPGCGCCEINLHRGDVGGWAILLPVNAGVGVGVVLAYCTNCIKKHDRAELTRRFVEQAQSELDIGLLTEH